MGNKASAAERRHSFDLHLEDDSQGTKKKNKKNKRENSRKSSQFQPVTPSKSGNDKESRSLDLKIYRSTSTIEEVSVTVNLVTVIDTVTVAIYIYIYRLVIKHNAQYNIKFTK